jgi:hypothetical protein
VTDTQEVKEFVGEFPTPGAKGRQPGRAKEVALRLRLDGDELALVLRLEQATQALVVEALATLGQVVCGFCAFLSKRAHGFSSLTAGNP